MMMMMMTAWWCPGVSVGSQRDLALELTGRYLWKSTTLATTSSQEKVLISFVGAEFSAWLDEPNFKRIPIFQPTSNHVAPTNQGWCFISSTHWVPKVLGWAEPLWWWRSLAWDPALWHPSSRTPQMDWPMIDFQIFEDPMCEMNVIMCFMGIGNKR